MKRFVEFIKKDTLVVLVLALYAIAAIAAPGKALAAFVASARTLVEVALIIFSVFLALGLFGVLVNKQAIGKRLGEGSGFKALLLAAGFGTILVGPVYAVFPLLKAFREHGARPAVIITVITAWAVKLPMVPLEVRFMGWQFSALRAVLTLVAAVLLGVVMEPLLKGAAEPGMDGVREADVAVEAVVEPSQLAG